MITFRQDDYLRRKKADGMSDDHQMVVDLRDYIQSFHISCGWYSKGFDFQLLNTRLAKYGEQPIQSRLHLDGIWFFRGWRGLKPMSSKLKHVSKFFGFEEKPDLHPDVWLNARGGQKEAMDEVVERCEADVRITRSCIEKALDLNLVKNIQRYP